MLCFSYQIEMLLKMKHIFYENCHVECRIVNLGIWTTVDVWLRSSFTISAVVCDRIHRLRDCDGGKLITLAHWSCTLKFVYSLLVICVLHLCHFIILYGVLSIICNSLMLYLTIICSPWTLVLTVFKFVINGGARSMFTSLFSLSLWLGRYVQYSSYEMA